MCVIGKYSSEYLELYENIEDVLQVIESDEENTRLPNYDLDPDQNFYNDYIPDINSFVVHLKIYQVLNIFSQIWIVISHL